MSKRRIDPRVEIGSVRLWVADLDRMLAFYGDMLGFQVTDVVAGTTAFLSAGAGHPQIVLLVRENSSAAPGACQFSIRFPDRDTLADAYRSLVQTGYALERAVDYGYRESLFVRDPEANQIELYYDRVREEWSHEAAGSPIVTTRPVDLASLASAGMNRTPSGGAETRLSPSVPPLSAETRKHLGDVRSRLLNLHKVLLDDAKTAYEMDRGRVKSNVSLLQLVINDPWFAWLHPLSELVVRMDEALQPDAPATEADGVALLEEVARLLSPGAATEDFAQRYYEALQRQPAVIVAHAEVRRVLKQAK